MSASVSEVRIAGYWHRAGSAARQPATLVVEPDAAGYLVQDEHGNPLLHADDAPTANERLGNVERRLTFADGSVFTSADNDAVDALLDGHRRGSGWLHRLESSWSWIVVAVIATAAFSLAFFLIGIPVASERIAHALPQRAGQAISSSTMEFLDKYLFEESQLDETRRSDIEAHVQARLLPLDARNDGIDYRIHFRRWTLGDEPVPNAFALPSGEIVLTDGFVNLTETQDEMDAVILHEIGHIVERHSLQRLVQATFVGATVMLVTGDGSGLADMGVGLGSLLVSSHYSRGHESAADRYAFDRMLQTGIDPIAFGTIMARMEASMSTREDEQNEDPEAAGDDLPTLLDYLSSHPNGKARIEQARRYSECFQRGETVCLLD